MKNTVIFYTGLSLWSMKKKSGAPSFFKTVELYVNRGWNVYMITLNEEDRSAGLIEKDKLFCMPTKKIYKLAQKKKIGKLFVWLRQQDFKRYSKKVSRNILKEVRKNVVIYAYEVHGVSAAKQVAKRYCLPLVTRFQGTLLFTEKDTFLNRLKRYPHFGALQEKADLIIMTNDGSQGMDTLRRVGNKSKNIKFWVNGLDLIEQKGQIHLRSVRDEIGIEKNDVMLLTVSRLEDWKRVDRAIVLLSKLKSDYPNCKLVIVGDGACKKELEDTAKELGIQDCVIFTGAIPHDDVYNYMYSCDIFLSLYDRTNVGNPLLESLTLGCCDVVLDGGDTRHFVENGVNARLVSMSEIDKLSEIVGELLENAEERKRLGCNAKKWATENLYSWETRMNMEYQEVEKLLQN